MNHRLTSVETFISINANVAGGLAENVWQSLAGSVGRFAVSLTLIWSSSFRLLASTEQLGDDNDFESSNNSVFVFRSSTYAFLIPPKAVHKYILHSCTCV